MEQNTHFPRETDAPEVLTDDAQIDLAAERILERYQAAFEELAK